MKIFLIDVRDEYFCHVLPQRLNSPNSSEKVKIMAYPPLGIQSLAPVLRRHGHEVCMFDTCHPKMKPEHIAQKVTEERPDIIALSFLSITAYKYMKNMAVKLKTAAPYIPVIAGGPFATMNAVNILNDCPEIDCVGRGEGEELLPDYLENIDNPAVVEGLTWRSEDKVIENPPRPLIGNLDKFPFPDRTSLPIEYIESLPLDVPAVLSLDKFCTVQTSRGCPFKCIYCDIPALNGGKWRCRSPEHVLNEMQLLHDHGYRSVYLTDDHFLMKEKRIQDICHGIIARQLKFRWGCEGRVDAIGVSQLPLMVRANCKMLAFGVESGSQKILERLKKHQTIEQVEHAINEAKKHGIQTAHGFFIIGSPGETQADILKSFRFAAKLNLDSFGFNRLSVYRGTPLWKEYVERGLIDDVRDWNKWFRCSEIDPTALPGDVVHRTRKKGYIILFTHLAFRHPLRTFRLLRRFGRHMKFADILKLLLSPFRKFKNPDTVKSAEPGR
ncbi:MAG: cobalamin B12-binding domain-containing protein [Bacteroidia bacterium]|nr:cobalamin B12-binding domain-containing protein [Bacteroidia bacterium]